MNQRHPSTQIAAASQGQQGQYSQQTTQVGKPGQPTGPMYATQNYLSPDVRQDVVAVLNQVLADATDLHSQAKFAHWNVKGMNFFQLHELFDELAEVLEGHVDLVAERATALGGQAMGTTRMAAARSQLPEVPTRTLTGPECVELLADRLATHDSNLAEAMRTTEQYGDLDTTDLLNEVSRDVSKYLYFLEAHLQTRSVSGTGQAASGLRTDSSGTQ